jgi:hypothetical protein
MANKKRNMVACSEMPCRPKKCVVTFRDTSGVDHAAVVSAESLYEAAVVALRQFRRADWSREGSLDLGSLRIEVWDQPTLYRVEVAKLEAWLKRSGGSPREVVLRNKLLEIART